MRGAILLLPLTASYHSTKLSPRQQYCFHRYCGLWLALSGVVFPAFERDLSLPHNVQTGSGPLLTSNSIDTGCCFFWGGEGGSTVRPFIVIWYRGELCLYPDEWCRSASRQKFRYVFALCVVCRLHYCACGSLYRIPLHVVNWQQIGVLHERNKTTACNNNNNNNIKEHQQTAILDTPHILREVLI